MSDELLWKEIERQSKIRSPLLDEEEFIPFISLEEVARRKGKTVGELTIDMHPHIEYTFRKAHPAKYTREEIAELRKNKDISNETAQEMLRAIDDKA